MSRPIARILSKASRADVSHEGVVWLNGVRVWSAGPTENLNQIQSDFLEWSQRQGKALDWVYQEKLGTQGLRPYQQRGKL
jgi:hypothetical protein